MPSLIRVDPRAPRSVSNLLHGSLTLITSNVTGAALGFALSLVVGRGLGGAGFGRWTFSLAWASALTMLSEFGLNTLLTREAARSKDQANRLLIGSLAAKLLLSGALGGAVWLASPFLGTDPESSAALRIAVLLAIAGTVYGSFTALFRAFEWMTPILWLNALGLVGQLIGAAWIVRAPVGWPVWSLMTLAAGAQIVQSLIALGLWWVRLKPRGGAPRPSFRLTTDMLRMAVPFAAAGALSAIQMRSSPLLLGYLSGAAAVGWFGAAARFGEAAKLIPNGIFGAVFPALAAGDGPRLLRGFQRALWVMAVGMALILILFAAPILRLTYGPAFLPAAATLVWLGLGLVPSLLNGGIELYLYAAGDEAYATRLSAVAVAVQVIASLPLISFFGASGAAAGIALGEVVIWWPLRRRMKTLQNKTRLEYVV